MFEIVSKNTDSWEGDDSASTLGDAIRRSLADEILRGDLDVGERLDEAELASRFEVSRTPVREAIRQLSVAGLVSIRPRRGAVVETIDAARVGKAFEAAAEMESISAGWAAIRGSLVRRAELVELNLRCRDAVENDDPSVFAAANRELHDRIAELADNESLSDAVRLVRIKTAPFQRARLAVKEDREISQKEHEVIVDAIVLGDSAAASAAMRRHVMRAGLSACAHILKTAG